MKPLSLALLILLTGFTLPSWSATEQPPVEIVKMAPKQSAADASHAYLMDVLKLALKESEQEFGPARLELNKLTFSQRVILNMLDHGDIIDVVASAPTTEREITFRSARVPLLMGLLGYRMMIIRPEDAERFKAINEPNQLKPLKSCQGSQWPDADIMENNGYEVVRAEQFHQLFELLLAGECDYFPRGITEGYAELEAYNRDNPTQPLQGFDDVLIYYQQPFLFYTSHIDFELAARIERGLEQAVDKGELLALMKKHPVTQDIFPLSRWKGKKIFKLDNPDLPKSMPLNQSKFWIDLEQPNASK